VKRAWGTRLTRLERQRLEETWQRGLGLADLLRHVAQRQVGPWDMPDVGQAAEECTGLARLLKEAR
jgi:hypothetical protein